MTTNSAVHTTFNTDLSVTFANGAGISSGGAWSASSRALKENIAKLTLPEAIDTLKNLNPVKFNYKKDKSENYVGFIAEDVPELVAQKNRKSLVTMDIVAVLTKVVKDQQQTIKELKERLEKLEKRK
mgnify:CR=1 FL=1